MHFLQCIPELYMDHISEDAVYGVVLQNVACPRATTPIHGLLVEREVAAYVYHAFVWHVLG